MDCPYPPVIISLLIGFVGGAAAMYHIQPWCCRMCPEEKK